MGDRSYVTLTVLVSQQDAAEEISEDSADEVNQDNIICCFGFSEVNYGSLPFLNALRDAGIAYESYWTAGYEFTAGMTTCRFTPDGECIEKTVYDDERNVPLDELMKLLEPQAHQQLIKCIRAHHDKVTSLPWSEDQVEFGKRYMARQLIELKAEQKS